MSLQRTLFCLLVPVVLALANVALAGQVMLIGGTRFTTTWNGTCDGSVCTFASPCTTISVVHMVTEPCEVYIDSTYNKILKINSTSDLQITSYNGETLTTSQIWNLNSQTKVLLRDFNILSTNNISLSAPNVSLITCNIESSASWPVTNFTNFEIHGSTLKFANAPTSDETTGLFTTQVNPSALAGTTSIAVFNSLVNTTTYSFIVTAGGASALFGWPSRLEISGTHFQDGVVFYYGIFSEFYISGGSRFEFRNALLTRNAIVSYDPAQPASTIDLADFSVNGIGGSAYIFDTPASNLGITTFKMNRAQLNAAPVLYPGAKFSLAETGSSVQVSQVTSNRQLGLFIFSTRFIGWVPFIVKDSTFSVVGATPGIGLQSTLANSGFAACFQNLNISAPFRGAAQIVVSVAGSVGINFTCPSVVGEIQFTQDTNLLGSLEVTQHILGSGTLKILSGQGQLRLRSIAVDSHIIANADTLTYLPSEPSVGIQNAAVIEAANWKIEWVLFPTLPVIATYYPLFNIIPGATLNMTNQNDAQWNITYTNNGSNIVYDFGAVSCNPACYQNHIDLTFRCMNKIICPCLSQWAGPVCECDQADAPSGAICAPSGGLNWLYNGDLHVADLQLLSILSNYTLNVNGSVFIDGNVTMGETTSLIANGIVVANGTLKGLCKLRELRTSQGCIVYSTINIQSLAFEFTNLTAIDLVFDVSDLSTDGSCIPPTPPDAMDSLVPATFACIQRTLMSSSAQWSFTLAGGQNASNPQDLDKLDFSTRILASGDRVNSEGQTTNLKTSSASANSCGSAVNPVGSMTLFISPCENPGNPASKSSKVKWYYYTIPIIAVVVIAAVILVLVFTVPAVRDAILPYRKS